jgi:hypothetical protein
MSVGGSSQSSSSRAAQEAERARKAQSAADAAPSGEAAKAAAPVLPADAAQQAQQQAAARDEFVPIALPAPGKKPPRRASETKKRDKARALDRPRRPKQPAGAAPAPLASRSLAQPPLAQEPLSSDAAASRPAAPGFEVSRERVGQAHRHLGRLLEGKGLDGKMSAPKELSAAVRDAFRLMGNPGELAALVDRLSPEQLTQAFGKMSYSDRSEVTKLLRQTDRATVTKVSEPLEKSGPFGAAERRTLADALRPDSGLPERLELRYTGTERPAAGSDVDSLKGKASASGMAKLLSKMHPNEAKDHVKKQVKTALDGYKAALSDPSLSPEQRQQRLGELKTELHQLKTDFRESGLLDAHRADKAGRELLGSLAGMVDNAAKFASAETPAEKIAAGAALGSDTWGSVSTILKQSIGQEHKGLLKKVDGMFAQGAKGVSAAVNGLAAWEHFQKGDISKGFEAALAAGSDGWTAVAPFLKDKLPKETLSGIGTILGGTQESIAAARKMVAAYHEGDTSAVIQHGLEMGKGALEVVSPLLQKAGWSKKVLGGLACGLQLGADAAHLAPSIAHLCTNDFNLTKEYIGHLQEVAKVGGADVVGGLVLYATGSKDAALMARGATLAMGELVQKGANEYSDNWDKHYNMEMRAGNHNSIHKFATNVLGFRKHSIERTSFANALTSGDEATKLLMRGIIQLARKDPAAAAMEFERLHKGGQIKLDSTNGYSWNT